MDLQLAEKTALDQVCMLNIRENVALRAKIIVMESELHQIRQENEELKKVEAPLDPPCML